MAYLTSEILEQYLYCPRYFYLYKIRRIRLSGDSNWEVVENNRNDIEQITFHYFSNISTILAIQAGQKIKNFKKLGNLLPLSYSCLKITPVRQFSIVNLVSKFYAFLNFVLLSICQESENKGKKKRYPISLALLPHIKDSQELIKENPTALIEYSDNKTVAIYQNFSLPQDIKEKSQINIINLFLVNLYHLNLTRIISIDYRTMKISFDSISSYNSRIFKSKLDALLKKFRSQEFEPDKLSPCNICEFKIFCEYSKEVTING